MFKNTLILLAGTALFIIILGLFLQNPNKFIVQNPTQPLTPVLKQITINDKVFDVEIADTPDERAKGLSDRDSLDQNSGMLFIFEQKGVVPSFWMKDMRFNIDIIWIGDGKIIGIEKNVPVPAAGTEDSSLAIYSPGKPIDYVLELNAGTSDTYNFQNGNRVKINL